MHAQTAQTYPLHHEPIPPSHQAPFTSVNTHVQFASRPSETNTTQPDHGTWTKQQANTDNSTRNAHRMPTSAPQTRHPLPSSLSL